MKHILCYLSVICIAICMVSCEKKEQQQEASGNSFNSYGFEGTYQMRTEVYYTNEAGEQEKQTRDIISTVPIYAKNNNLYIRTNSFGMPNTGAYDLAEVEYTLDPPYDPPTPPANEENTGGGVIENVEKDTIPVILIANGVVYVQKGNINLKSLPIQAREVQQDRILFTNSNTFDVPVTNATGDPIATLRCHYEYGPATLNDSTLTWDVVLVGDGGTNTTGDDIDIRIKYHNSLTRK